MADTITTTNNLITFENEGNSINDAQFPKSDLRYNYNNDTGRILIYLESRKTRGAIYDGLLEDIEIDGATTESDKLDNLSTITT